MVSEREGSNYRARRNRSQSPSAGRSSSPLRLACPASAGSASRIRSRASRRRRTRRSSRLQAPPSRRTSPRTASAVRPIDGARQEPSARVRQPLEVRLTGRFAAIETPLRHRVLRPRRRAAGKRTEQHGGKQREDGRDREFERVAERTDARSAIAAVMQIAISTQTVPDRVARGRPTQWPLQSRPQLRKRHHVPGLGGGPEGGVPLRSICSSLKRGIRFGLAVSSQNSGVSDAKGLRSQSPSRWYGCWREGLVTPSNPLFRGQVGHPSYGGSAC